MVSLKKRTLFQTFPSSTAKTHETVFKFQKYFTPTPDRFYHTSIKNPDIFSTKIDRDVRLFSVLPKPFPIDAKRNGKSASVHFESVSTPIHF